MSGSPDPTGATGGTAPLPPAPLGRGDLLLDRLSSLSSNLAESVGLVERPQPPVSQAEKDRSWIAKQIIGVFTLAVGCVFLLLALQGFMTGHWDVQANYASEIIKTAVLPVVTLVLGFYFGSRDGKG